MEIILNNVLKFIIHSFCVKLKEIVKYFEFRRSCFPFKFFGSVNAHQIVVLFRLEFFWPQQFCFCNNLIWESGVVTFQLYTASSTPRRFHWSILWISPQVWSVSMWSMWCGRCEYHTTTLEYLQALTQNYANKSQALKVPSKTWKYTFLTHMLVGTNLGL